VEAITETAKRTRAASAKSEHFDVVIIGAGISGIGGAYHLTKQCPGMSFLVHDAQESLEGTWLTHRYPGIRSDSDLYTFGCRFKPWTVAPQELPPRSSPTWAQSSTKTTAAQHPPSPPDLLGTLVQQRRPLDTRGGPDRSQ
jgi:cation diffusion facilitator CzcD-associated flavoprotein CzcO